MNRLRVWVVPLLAASMGSAMLAGSYFAIVSLAESPQHAVDLFLEDLWIVAPILLGFGVQVGLYTAVRRIRMPGHGSAAGGGLMGAGGASSTIAMAACCAHHVADALPLLGLTAGAAFLAQYRIPFMIIGLATNLLGIAVLTRQLRRLRGGHALPRPFPGGRMKVRSTLALLATMAALAGCTAQEAATPGPATPTPPTPAKETQDQTRIDSQGAVVVEVTPLDLDDENELRFQVRMNTHSVDLSMDLSALTELQTDVGAHVQAVSWDGPAGGHHVSGTLVFPAQVNGQSLLAGARQLILVLWGIDSIERRFVWELDS